MGVILLGQISAAAKRQQRRLSLLLWGDMQISDVLIIRRWPLDCSEADKLQSNGECFCLPEKS